MNDTATVGDLSGCSARARSSSFATASAVASTGAPCGIVTDASIDAMKRNPGRPRQHQTDGHDHGADADRYRSTGWADAVRRSSLDLPGSSNPSTTVATLPSAPIHSTRSPNSAPRYACPIVSTTCAPVRQLADDRLLRFESGNVVIAVDIALDFGADERRVDAEVELDHHRAHPLGRRRLDPLDAVDALDRFLDPGVHRLLDLLRGGPQVRHLDGEHSSSRAWS